jgi:hypothetical protein
MSAQPVRFLEERIRRIARLLAPGLGAIWRLVRAPLVLALNLFLALLLLFEEWGWRPLSNLLAQLSRFRIWALAEQWVAGLPPYGALGALIVPSAIILPAKLLGVYFLATGHFVVAAGVILAAKIIGTGLVARIFLLTKPSLMQIGWFNAAYEKFVPWQEALFERIRSSWIWRHARLLRQRANAFLKRSWATLRPQLQALLEHARGKTRQEPQRHEGAHPIAGEASRPPPGGAA